MDKHLNRFGTHQELHWKPFRRDKYGLIAGSCERHIVEEANAVPNFDLLDLGSAPKIDLPCVGVERVWDDRIKYGVYTYTYEGIRDSYDSKFPEDRIVCSLEGTDKEEPVDTHPSFQMLFAKYAGKMRNGQFSHFAEKCMIQGKEEFNPLFGVTHYLTFGLVFTRTWAAKVMPKDITRNVDCIDTPMGTARVPVPALDPGRNWLKLAPTVQQRGNGVLMSLRWLASGRRGFNPDMYAKSR